MEWVVGKIKSKKIDSVIELAGNQGVLSIVISSLSHVSRVVCSDYDYGATNRLFSKLINSTNSNNIYVCNFDFMSDYREQLYLERAIRLKSECLIVLAVTHHLMLTQHYSLASILNSFESFTNKYLIIEFMPLGLWDGKFAPNIPDWYSRDFFESVILSKCIILMSLILKKIELFISVKKLSMKHKFCCIEKMSFLVLKLWIIIKSVFMKEIALQSLKMKQ